jgi:hypothetical protein
MTNKKQNLFHVFCAIFQRMLSWSWKSEVVSVWDFIGSEASWGDCIDASWPWSAVQIYTWWP